MKRLIELSQTLTLVTIIAASTYLLLDIMMMHQESVKGITELAKTFPQ
jgi:hypothetical protein